MNRNDPRIQERTDASHRIGIDACGLAHYHDAQLGVVWTTTALGDVAHVIPVDGLGEWVDHVADDRGWQCCHYATESLAEQLADALTQEAV